MANTFTPKLENFFDNNVSGGYIETAANIGGDDLTARINAVLDTKGYLTSNSNISWLKITGKPNFFSGNYQDLSGKPNLSVIGQTGQWADILNRPSFHAVAITGNYEDLNHLPDLSNIGNNNNNNIQITNLLDEGTSIATITIENDDNSPYIIKIPEINNNNNNNNNDNFITEETDPIFTDWLETSPLTDITSEKIQEWDNKSDFDPEELHNVAFTGSFFDLRHLPFTTINLEHFYNDNLSEIENNNFKNLFSSSRYILNYQDFIDNTSLEHKTLKTVFTEVIQNYFINYMIFDIRTSENFYEVLHIDKIQDNNDAILYYVLTLTPINQTNYNLLRENIDSSDESTIINCFNNLTVNTKNITLIIDPIYNIMYTKI